jgi:sigma-E factor negative regulatory protein RseA
MDRTQETRAMLSDFADGQLDESQLIDLIESIRHDDDALLTWESYQLSREYLQVGGAFDGAAWQSDGLAPDFLVRLRQRLSVASFDASESLADMPHEPPRDSQRELPIASRSEAANSPIFKWRLIAGIATVSAMASLAWVMMPARDGFAPADQIATQQQVVPTTQTVEVSLTDAPGVVMLRDRRLDALLAAHKQAAGGSALQAPAGFLRNATFDGASR